MTEKKETLAAHSHSHMWIVGVLGIAAGLVLMLYVPSLKAVSQGVLLFATFHIVDGPQAERRCLRQSDHKPRHIDVRDIEDARPGT